MGMELIWYKLLTVNQKRVGSTPTYPIILEYQSGLMAQTANLLIREFKSHLQVLCSYS